MSTSLLWAAGGTGFTFLMTTLGASVVFFFRKEVNASVQRIFLGFAAGVMVAASVWSLLIPAIEEASLNGGIGWIPAAGGFLLGVFFLIALDTYLPHLHPDCSNPGCNEAEGVSSSWKRTTLLVMAVTLHNIPEGMAVGLSFALAAQHGNDPALYTAAWLSPSVSVFRISRKARQSPFPCVRKVFPPVRHSSAAVCQVS